MAHSQLIKFLVLGVFFFSLISFASAINITVTMPRDAPTNVNATLLSGGSLDANTTYYVTVINRDFYTTPAYASTGTSNRFGYHSPISEIVNFTTNDTHKSYQICWTSAPDESNVGNVYFDNYYDVLITKDEGNWSLAGGYSTERETTGYDFPDGGCYNLTDEGNTQYLIHSISKENDWVYDRFNITKKGGTIKVYIDDGTLSYNAQYNYAYAFKTIYDAIVSANLSEDDGNYAYFDGQTFVLKGWIVMDGSSTTFLQTRNMDLWFIKGGLHINNPSATFRFGLLVDDDFGGYYDQGGNIYLFHSRYPFRKVDGNLEVYGSRIIGSYGFTALNPDLLDSIYYDGGAQEYLYKEIEEIRDNMLGVYARGVTSEVKDLKIGIGNNWHNSDSYRLKIVNNRALCYSQNCRIYDTAWVTSLTGISAMRIYVPGSGANYSTFIYDGLFTEYSDDNIPDEFYFMTSYGCLKSSSFMTFLGSLAIDIIDSDGNPIEGVTISGTDKRGNNITWIEHEGGTDRGITGNEYNFNVTTNENGTADYYLYSYNVTLNESNNIAETYNDNVNFTYYYPYDITISKEGYADYTFRMDNFTYRTNLLVSLEDRTWNYSKPLKIQVLNGSGTTIMKLQTDTGNLAIAGNLYENTNSSTINSQTDVKFKIPGILALTNWGDLYLLGEILEEII